MITVVSPSDDVEGEAVEDALGAEGFVDVLS